MEEKKSSFAFKYDVKNGTGEETMKSKPNGVSLCFGQVGQNGVSALSKLSIFKINKAKQICDFGMAYGLLLLQLFEECSHINKAIGVEIQPERYNIAVINLRSFGEHLRKKKDILYVDFKNTDTKITMTSGSHGGKKRRIIMEKGSVVNYPQYIRRADVVFLHIVFDTDLHKSLGELISQAKKKCIILSYQDLIADDIISTNLTVVDHNTNIST